jgi:hypothetical protein
MVLRSLETGLLSSDGMRDGDETPLMKVKNEELTSKIIQEPKEIIT